MLPVTTRLEALWRQRLTVLLTNLAEGQAEFREIGTLSKHIEADYQGRFLIELLQNAADQTVGMPRARILIVWTDEFLAVANQGAPFSSEGLNAITSIALSPKRPDETIGNKGVGFKSVFEVTDAPEIFSAADPDRGLAEPPGICWRLEQTPFEQADARDHAWSIASEILAAAPLLWRRLAERYPDQLRQVFQNALRQSAPFKYPSALAEELFDARARALGLSADTLRDFQTLIVLPLRKGRQKAVDGAVSELFAPDSALMVFLPVVTELELRATAGSQARQVKLWREDLAQHEMGVARVIDRRTCYEATLTDGWMSVRERLTGRAPHVLERLTPGTRQRQWWVVERRVGTDLEEGEALNALARTLPGDNWKDVRQVPLAIAMPSPDPATLALEADGRFVVGLPTQVKTGSPLWVDSHFHATLSRTGLNLEGNPFNHYLFERATELVRVLVGFLKLPREPGTLSSDPSASTGLGGATLEQLSVTLVFLCEKGPLSAALHAPGGPAHDEVVLSADGRIFVRAADLRLPPQDDVIAFLELGKNGTDPALADAGYQLPHAALLKHHHALLKSLGAILTPADDGCPACLTRRSGREALVETWARRFRAAGPEHWVRFLKWLLRRFDEAHLRPLQILPTGIDRLSAPEEVVFLSLIERPQSDEPAASEVPDVVQAALLLIDPSALPCRTATGELTETGRLLTGEPDARRWLSAPRDTKKRLLSRPTWKALLEGPLPGALEQAVEDGEDSLCWLLFSTAVDWLCRGRDDDRPNGLRFHVPMADGRWASAPAVYLGEGWLEDQADGPAREVLLERLYRGRRTCSWASFSGRLGVDASRRGQLRAAWLAMGVADRPRVLVYPTVRLSRLADGKVGNATEVACPIPGLEVAWQTYLQHLNLPSSWQNSTQSFPLEPWWVDGLEQPAHVQPLLGWLIDHPAGLPLEIEIQTDAYWLKSKAPPWWLYYARSLNLPIIPTDARSWTGGQRCLAADVCILAESDLATSLRLLPHLAKGVDEALPRALGVLSLKDAGGTWLLERLQQLAGRWELGQFADVDLVEALTLELYRRLDAVETQWDARNAVTRPLPLWRGHQLTTGILSEEPVLYIEDDRYRARYAGGYANAAHLPVPRNARLATVATQLAAALPTGRVIRTSKAALEIPFRSATEPTGLLSWLGFHCRVAQLELHLAVAVVHSRGHVKEVGTHHRAVWKRFRETRLVFGHFSDDNQAFYDASRGLLLAAQDLQANPFPLLAECWPVLGIAYLEVWEAISARLARGEDQLRRYFRDRHVLPYEYEQVRLAFEIPLPAGVQGHQGAESTSSEQRGAFPVPAPSEMPASTRNAPALTETSPDHATARMPGSDGEAEAAPRTLTIVGMPMPVDEFIDALRQGTDGAVGMRLRDHVMGPNVGGASENVADIVQRLVAFEASIQPAAGQGLSGGQRPVPGDPTTTRNTGMRAPRIDDGAGKDSDPDCASDEDELEEAVPGDDSEELPNAATKSMAGTRRRLQMPRWATREEDPWIGTVGEAFAYEQLRAWLPDFAEHCWISPLRTDYGLEGPVEPAAGYDFRYQDTHGILSGVPGTECWIEVKSQRGRLDPWVELSRNEWNTARTCHETEGRMYVLLRIADVARSPRAAALIRDPFGLYLSHRTRLYLEKIWLWAGREAGRERTAPDSLPVVDPGEPGAELSPGDAAPSQAHIGVVKTYTWTSRRGYDYDVNYWSCCGQNEGEGQCTRIPGRYHPGTVIGHGSRSGGGAGRGSWTCCHQDRYVPGCQEEGHEEPDGW